MVRLTRHPSVTLIELEASYNSLDEKALDELGGLLLTKATLIEPPEMIIDLSKTSYIGSMFIELLVRTWKRLAERGGRLAVCGLHPFCAEVLRISRLDTVWLVFPDQETAVKAMEASAKRGDEAATNPR